MLNNCYQSSLIFLLVVILEPLSVVFGFLNFTQQHKVGNHFVKAPRYKKIGMIIFNK
jgi:hypothetical protein